MIIALPTKEVLFMAMSEQRLRKAVSDASYEINNYELTSETMVEVLKQEECACCGLKEDCTLDYIAKVKGSHLGNWVCGLCLEAVKEKLAKGPTNMAMQDAVSSHRDFLHSFNTTTRVNPKLSLTITLRGIARRSFESRNSRNCSISRLARSISCVPSINIEK